MHIDVGTPMSFFMQYIYLVFLKQLWNDGNYELDSLLFSTGECIFINGKIVISYSNSH